MPSDARIILCTAKPAWLGRHRRYRITEVLKALWRRIRGQQTAAPDSWDRLLYFRKRTLGPDQELTQHPQIRLVISGDKHFYTRHKPTGGSDDVPLSGREPALVTAGGGGAYLSSTLDARNKLDVPLFWESATTTEYTLDPAFPTRKKAWLIGVSGLWRLPIRNPALAVIFGVVYALFGWVARAGGTNGADASERRVEDLADGSFPSAVRTALDGIIDTTSGRALALVVAAALYGLAAAHKTPKVVAAAVWIPHVVLQALAIGATVAIAAEIAIPNDGSTVLRWPLMIWAALAIVSLARTAFLWFYDRASEWRSSAVALGGLIVLMVVEVFFAEPGGNWTNFAFVLSLFLLGAIIGTVVFAIYLVAAQSAHVNTNELFVGLRHEGYKQFLRVHVTDDGVEAFSIGYKRVARRSVTWNEGRPVVTVPTKFAKKAGHVLVDRFTVAPDAGATRRASSTCPSRSRDGADA
jgi:hypothetical protein